MTTSQIALDADALVAAVAAHEGDLAPCWVLRTYLDGALLVPTATGHRFAGMFRRRVLDAAETDGLLVLGPLMTPPAYSGAPEEWTKRGVSMGRTIRLGGGR